MAQLGELPLANLAAVRLDAQVDPGVLGQVRGVRERLRALGAFVRLRLAHVDLRMELQVRLATEDLRTINRPTDSSINKVKKKKGKKKKKIKEKEKKQNSTRKCKCTTMP